METQPQPEVTKNFTLPIIPAATIAGITPRHLRLLARAGKIDFKIFGKTMLFNINDLEILKQTPNKKGRTRGAKTGTRKEKIKAKATRAVGRPKKGETMTIEINDGTKHVEHGFYAVQIDKVIVTKGNVKLKVHTIENNSGKSE